MLHLSCSECHLDKLSCDWYKLTLVFTWSSNKHEALMDLYSI